MDQDVLGDKKVDATEEVVERALGWMSSNIANMAQSISNRQHMEQWIKTVEAQEKAKRKADPAHVQEREARASDDYRIAVDAFRDASFEEQKLRYTWQFAETVIEVWRTRCANERKV